MVKNNEEVSNYDDILDRSWDEIPEVETLPDGTYVLKGRNAAYSGPKTEGQNGKVLFFYKVDSPIEVDAEALASLGADYDIRENEAVFTIWIEGMKDWDAVRDHLALHGVDVADFANIRETLKKGFKGTKVAAQLSTNVYTNKTTNVTTISNVPSNFASLG